MVEEGGVEESEIDMDDVDQSEAAESDHFEECESVTRSIEIHKLYYSSLLMRGLFISQCPHSLPRAFKKNKQILPSKRPNVIRISFPAPI